MFRGEHGTPSSCVRTQRAGSKSVTSPSWGPGGRAEGGGAGSSLCPQRLVSLPAIFQDLLLSNPRLCPRLVSLNMCAARWWVSCLAGLGIVLPGVRPLRSKAIRGHDVERMGPSPCVWQGVRDPLRRDRTPRTSPRLRSAVWLNGKKGQHQVLTLLILVEDLHVCEIHGHVREGFLPSAGVRGQKRGGLFMCPPVPLLGGSAWPGC
jgi:hypothetical protein